MKCKDCIHQDMCFVSIIERIEGGCQCFKDKSKFIELPCKVGDVIWNASEVGLIWSCSITEIRIYKDEIIIEADDFNYYTPFDFGKTVFLTKEEAEKKLKELEK